MGVILRTAGASRTKTEIKRDFEYLIRLWETGCRDLTLSRPRRRWSMRRLLVKRSIRDLSTRTSTEVLVAADESYKGRQDFMRMLMPSHAKNVNRPRHAPIFTASASRASSTPCSQPVGNALRRSSSQSDRGAVSDRRQFGPRHARAPHRGHCAQDAIWKHPRRSRGSFFRLRDLAGLIVIDYIRHDEKRNTARSSVV